MPFNTTCFRLWLCERSRERVRWKKHANLNLHTRCAFHSSAQLIVSSSSFLTLLLLFIFFYFGVICSIASLDEVYHPRKMSTENGKKKLKKNTTKEQKKLSWGLRAYGQINVIAEFSFTFLLFDDRLKEGHVVTELTIESFFSAQENCGWMEQ